LNRPDEKLDDGAHQGVLAIYKALLILETADPAQFWPAMPVEVRPEALGILDAVVEKLVGLAVAERLDRIVRAAGRRRRS
jgi:hypothetical protein